MVYAEINTRDFIKMKKPKFLDLDTAERVKYTVKLDEILLNKYRELANLTDKPINETIESVLEDYIEDKVIYNTYLEDYRSFYIQIPYNLLVKDFITKASYDDVYDLKKNYKKSDYAEVINLVKEVYAEEIAGNIEEANLMGIDLESITKGNTYYKYNNPSMDTVKLYKVLRVPNNLDRWNTMTKTYSSYYRFDDDTSHAGLEFFIIPAIAYYTDDFRDCLYCFYLELINNELLMISIEYLEALDLIEEAGNEYLLKLANNIYEDLENAESIDDVKKYANYYNTGNIRASMPMDSEKVEPMKILVGKNNKTTISHHDKQLIRKIELLEKENKQLKEDIDTIEDKTLEKVEDKLKNLLDEYGIDLKNDDD